MSRLVLKLAGNLSTNQIKALKMKSFSVIIRDTFKKALSF